MLRKKTFRDIKANLAQFFTIFAMVFLACFAYTGVNSYSDGMKVTGDRIYQEGNLQDLWVYGENFTDEDLQAIKEIPGIAGAERMLTLPVTGDITADGGTVTVPMEVTFLDADLTEKNISRITLREGAEYDPDADGLWINYNFAHARDLHPGDTVTLHYETYSLEKEILGVISLPDHLYTVSDDSVIFQNPEDFGWVLLSMKQFPKEILEAQASSAAAVTNLIQLVNPDFEFSPSYFYPQVIVDVEGDAPSAYASQSEKDPWDKKLDEIKTALYEVKGVSAVTGRDVWGSCMTLKSESEEGDTYSGLFSSLFVFIAALSVITTMNRFVKKQRVQIGTLKALGFRNRAINLHYVSYGFFVTLLAAAAGTVMGVFLGKPFLNMELSMFDLPGARLVIRPKNYILAAAIVLAITVVTYLSCRKILKESAAQTLRLEVPTVKVKAGSGRRSDGPLSRLPFSTKWNLRDMARSKPRCIMAIVGIMGSTMLIVLAFGMQDSLQHYLSWEFDHIQNFEYKMTLSNGISENTLNGLMDSYGPGTSQTAAIEYIDSSGKTVTSVLTVNDSDGHLRVSAHDRTTYDINEGIPGSTDGNVSDAGALYITEKLSKMSGFKLGDTVRWHVLSEDEWYETPVVSVCRDPQSQQFCMTRAAFEGLGRSYAPDTLYTDEDLSSLTDADTGGVSAIVSNASLQEQMNSMLNMISSMILLFIGVAALLGFIIIYNMGILSLSEKMYQFATLKVLGFRFRKLSAIYIEQNFWITVIGTLLGLPAGFAMTDIFFKYAIGDNYDFFAVIDPSAYLLAVFGTIVIMLFTSAILSRQLKKIDMVASLKANE